MFNVLFNVNKIHHEERTKTKRELNSMTESNDKHYQQFGIQNLASF